MNLFIQLLIWRDRRAQDLIEYALLVGLLSMTAAALMPDIAEGMYTVFLKVSYYLTLAGGGGRKTNIIF